MLSCRRNEGTFHSFQYHKGGELGTLECTPMVSYVGIYSESSETLFLPQEGTPEDGLPWAWCRMSGRSMWRDLWIERNKTFTSSTSLPLMDFLSHRPWWKWLLVTSMTTAQCVIRWASGIKLLLKNRLYFLQNGSQAHFSLNSKQHLLLSIEHKREGSRIWDQMS